MYISANRKGQLIKDTCPLLCRKAILCHNIFFFQHDPHSLTSFTIIIQLDYSPHMMFYMMFYSSLIIAVLSVSLCAADNTSSLRGNSIDNNNEQQCPHKSNRHLLTVICSRKATQPFPGECKLLIQLYFT